LSLPTRSSPLAGYSQLPPKIEEERERRRAQAPITVSAHPPQTFYLLDLSLERTKEVFESEFPQLNFEGPAPDSLSSPAAGAVLEIIITGVSIGAGIVATSFLQECGKKLWNAVEGLLASKATHAEKAAETSSIRPKKDTGDIVHIILRLDNSSVEATVSGLRSDSVVELQTFLTETPVRLFDSASKVLGTGEHCPACKYGVQSVIDLPCRHCVYNGDKLRLVRNVACTLDGTPLEREVADIESQRRGNFYEPVEGA